MSLLLPYFKAIHCKWNGWKEGTCSKTCGTGSRMDTRVKLVEEDHGGTCDGQEAEIVECNTDPCPSIEQYII